MLKRLLVRSFGAAVVGGTPHAEYLQSLGMNSSRIFMGYDVVDNDHFSQGAEVARKRSNALRRELHLPERYFLACSRFAPKKNLLGLLEGFSLYRESVRHESAWDLVIVGDGEMRGRLEAKRVQLGLEGVAHLVGPRGYEELPGYYGLASAFVHASTVEQWGLVVNEAMAAALPVVISTRCGCAQDLVREGLNGYLFDPFDPKALAAVLRRMSEGQAHLSAMGRASREIISKWSPQAFSRAFRAASEIASAEPRPIRMIDALATKAAMVLAGT
jgi:glycosyltransferase involved in cell wall biosynthesis